MPRALTLAQAAPPDVLSGARELGRRVRLARLRRRIPLRELASRAAVSYDTARAVEAGNLTTGIGAYFALISTLGLAHEYAHLLDPDTDTVGKQAELARTPMRARRSRAP